MEAAKRKFKPLNEFFGNLLPDQITENLCEKYASKRGKKNTTVRNELAVLRSAVNWHDKNNRAIFKFPAPAAPKDHHLTKDEAAKLLAAAKAPHLRLFIILALTTGARSNALLDLTWDRVDFEKNIVDLRASENDGKKRALVPMNERLKRALVDAYQARACNYVIDFGGKRVQSVRKGFGRIAKAAGITASPHILRHTAAVWMAEDGVPMSEISQFLGHSSTAITEKVYARYSPAYLKKAASSLNF